MPTRNAEAQWNGSLKEGKGTMRLGGGAYEGPFTFKSRFEEGDGTNPEELIAAAHAGCYSMALSAGLGKAGYTPDSVRTTAKVHLEPKDGKPTIGKIDLVCRAKVPGIKAEEFQKIAAETKEGCPVSRVLSAAEITLDAKLEG